MKTKKLIKINGENYTLYLRELATPLEIKCENLNGCYNSYSPMKLAAFNECVEREKTIADLINSVCYCGGIYSKSITRFTYATNFFKNGKLIAVYYDSSTKDYTNHSITVYNKEFFDNFPTK